MLKKCRTSGGAGVREKVAKALTKELGFVFGVA